MNPLLLSNVLSNNGFTSIICYWYHNHKVIACFLSYRLFVNLVSLSLITTLGNQAYIYSSFYLKIHDSLYFSCLQSLLNHNRALIPTVTTLIFLHSFLQYIGNFQVIFFFNTQVPPKFRQSLPYIGRSQVINIYPVYTSNISYLITQNHDPIILGLNPTHYHQHNTSYSITSYNVVQMKDSISTINMHGQIGTKSFNH